VDGPRGTGLESSRIWPRSREGSALEGKDRDNRLLRSVIKVMALLHRWLYRTSGGRVGGNWANDRMPVLLLTTTGKRTEKERTWPVGYMRDGDAYAVVASNGGLHSHPAWYHNLTTEARASIEVNGSRLAVRAATAEGVERVRLWARIVKRYPNFVKYQEEVTRELPVVLRPTP
jgi:deazaflavin-dependent oxidoreductase (nitroreductase family)